jgi:putative colanic acid biosynthesis UDP-glucose lipid carrier transferase
MRDDRQPTLLTYAPLIDGVLVFFAGWLAYWLRWDAWSIPQNYLFVLILGTALAVVLLPLSGAYQSWRGKVQWGAIGHTLPALFSVAVILALIGTLTKTTADFSRLWMAYWFSLALAAMFVLRWLSWRIHQLQRNSGAGRRHIVIVGDGDFASSVAGQLLANPDLSVEIHGFIATGEADEALPLPAPLLGRLEDIDTILAAAEDTLEEVWIAVSDFSAEHRQSISRMLQSSCLAIRYVPDLTMLTLLNHRPREVAGMTVLELNASPLDGHNALLKSAFDKVFAAVALVLLSPLICIIALAIKLDSPGPVFFRQHRHGWDGKIIEVLKFRTMSQSDSPVDTGRQAVKNDPRVTSLGRWLRRSSLDELPQFYNVLRGNMSVVGPRPHPVALNENFTHQIDAYMQRHRVKPGITGWAQVHGLRGETETLDKMQKRVEYDLYYIENWSLWLDVKIILQTVIAGWAGKNAY